jgi:hypothetical protein
MKVYAVLNEDRQHGVDVDLFYDKEDAIEVARDIARDNASYAEDIEEQELTQEMLNDGWVLDVTYSIEEDRVCVLKRELK